MVPNAVERSAGDAGRRCAGARFAVGGGRVLLAVRGSVRRVAPALAAYAMARALGLAVLAVWAQQRQLSWPARLMRFDAAWYVRVAVHGYDTSVEVSHHGHAVLPNLAFFPLYPALIRLGDVLGMLSPAHTALLLAQVCAPAAAWGIAECAMLLHGRTAAWIAAVLWGCWPAAVVQNMAYTESLMTACAAWCLYAALLRRWLTAGLLAGLAGLSRPSGCAAAFGLAAAVGCRLLAGRGRGRGRRSVPAARGVRWRPVLAVVVAAAGWLGFVGWVAWRLGRVDGYFAVQRQWRSTFDWGYGTGRWFMVLLAGPFGRPLAVVVAAATLAGCIGLLVWCCLGRQPVLLVGYSLVLVVIASGDSMYFASRTRFLLPAFPLLFPLARVLSQSRARWVRVVVVGGCAVCSALLGGYYCFVWPQAP